MNCKQPDKDEPKLICGYPIPCPYHTAIIEDGSVTIPENFSSRYIQRVRGVAKALKK